MDHGWFGVGNPLSVRRTRALLMLSFALPLALWSAISYLPFVWHPLVHVVDVGDGGYFKADMLVEREVFAEENEKARAEGRAVATGFPANPVYLPAPHAVATALVTAFETAPLLPDEPWLHQSLWQSMQVIFWGFVLSSLVAVPLGLLAGTFSLFSNLVEPFVEFFRYLPAPAFGALAVAILGIYDAPKIAIVFIGTFFQQVLVVANTTKRIERPLLEAAQTLGADKMQLLLRVVIPAAVVDLYSDMRVLLGCAWTYLIVAELVGTTSGITRFIYQQARYRHYENVFAAIIIIGAVGLFCDSSLAWIGRRLFPWRPDAVVMGGLWGRTKAVLSAAGGEAAANAKVA